MSSDDVNERQRKCREQYSTISKEFRNVLVKVDAIEAPTKKKQKKSKNAEAAKESTQETAASVKAACKDLADTISGVLKELGDEEGGAPGPSGCPPSGN